MTIKDKFLAAYDKYAEGLLRHIYLRVSNQEVAEDLLQDVVLRAWRYIAEGEEITNLKAFFYQIAHNLIIDYYRRQKSDVSLEETIEAGEQFVSEEKDALAELCDKETIAACLKELDTETRQIIIWRYIDDLSIKEISEIINKTPNNISVIIHRGLKKLREKMKHV